tara:strand:+ start:1299 stop:2246 length:948 start_codon:yes stop_codon:yes gene_type:complete
MSEILYPPITPYEDGHLDVGDGHSLYWEVSGNPDGVPIVFLHGGPGSGSSPWQRQLFNPDKYKIILFDQRGAGKSTPHAGLDHNTTPHLINDIECLRKHLSLTDWHVSGGSWGATLGLAYAHAHPDRVRSLVLYGIFLCRPQELEDHFGHGAASRIYADAYERFLSVLPSDKRADPIKAYAEVFNSSDTAHVHQAVQEWTRWEKQVSALVVTDEKLAEEIQDPDFVLAHSRLENHYFINGGFIDGDQIISELEDRIGGKTVHLVQGRYDLVCPFQTAWDVHKALPDSHLHILPTAGHTAKEPQTTKKLIEILDKL